MCRRPRLNFMSLAAFCSVGSSLVRSNADSPLTGASRGPWLPRIIGLRFRFIAAFTDTIWAALPSDWFRFLSRSRPIQSPHLFLHHPHIIPLSVGQEIHLRVLRQFSGPCNLRLSSYEWISFNFLCSTISATYNQAASCNVTWTVTCQKHHPVCNFLWVSKSPHRGFVDVWLKLLAST